MKWAKKEGLDDHAVQNCRSCCQQFQQFRDSAASCIAFCARLFSACGIICFSACKHRTFSRCKLADASASQTSESNFQSTVVSSQARSDLVLVATDVQFVKEAQNFNSSAATWPVSTLSKIIQIAFPGPAWYRHDISTEGIESVSSVELKKVPAMPVFVNKSLELVECPAGVKVSHCVLEREMSSTVISIDAKIENAGDAAALDLASIVETFNQMRVCRGGSPQQTFPAVLLECASLDRTVLWRLPPFFSVVQKHSVRQWIARQWTAH